jgi:peptide/nickel transport system substrate-binding protein
MAAIGEADIAHAIGEQDATNPQTDFSYLNSETTFLRIDATQPPLNDIRVRLALNYAVDKKGLIGTVMPKAALLATQIVVPSIPGHNHELDKNPRPYDPAKAKQLLAEAKAAGVPSDAEITLINYPVNFPGAGELMESIQTMYKAAGFNIKMISVDPGQYAKWNIKPFPDPRPPTLLLTSHDNNNGDPIFSMTSRFFCDGRSSTICVPDLEKEMNRVIGLDGPARVAGWEGVFKTIYNDIVPDVMLHHMVAFTRVNPRIVFVPDITTNAEIRVQEIRFK